MVEKKVYDGEVQMVERKEHGGGVHHVGDIRDVKSVHEGTKDAKVQEFGAIELVSVAKIQKYSIFGQNSRIR